MSISDDINNLKAKIHRETEAELLQRKAVLNLDGFAVKAEQRVRDLAARATEIADVQKAYRLDANDEALLLSERPGLQPWVDALHQAQRHLHGLTFGHQATLQRALEAHKRLTLEDFALPHPPELPEPTPFGPVPLAVWRLREALGNIGPLEDVDEAIVRLRTAHAALAERIGAVAAS